ncbi:DegT/DnrJ/EryC1/StrS aminotransferase family protein [Selenomonas sp. FC4001]|uniref:DegT/DnrJ/EryC1/StrS family aminotransferase n=1 Tax=Selenomonas sp. FC4001 TaxID=1408313 RepID=UPI000565A9BD|nr:DegT/DnrJ/EryC1/StrS family aminotransferase [Selenomonas sp. FC4001]
MKIPFSPPDITEEEIKEVAEAMRSGWITTGPRTKELEKQLSEYMGTNKTVCLNSATAALEMTMHVLGIGAGDEVITSAYTYTASASAAVHVGASVVLVDTAPGSYEMDYDKLAAAITEKTKAIVPVDLGGVICDYEKIFDIVESKQKLFKPANEIQKAIGRVAVVADCAHALGAERKGKLAGNIADFSSFSFHAVKNFTTAEGGCATWRSIPGIHDEEIYKTYQLLSLHGQNKDALAKTKLGAWEYDIKGCYYKCNMTDIMAAMGLIQLKRYPSMLARRQEIISRYNDGFKDAGVEVLRHFGDGFRSSGHLYLIRLIGQDEGYRNAFIEKMAEKGVATNVHYKPLPMHTAYKNMGFDIKNYPNAYAQFANEVSLPLHTRLTNEEVDYVIECLLHTLKELEQ